MWTLGKMKNQELKQNDVLVVAAAANDIDDEKSIENNCQLHIGCGMKNINIFVCVYVVRPLCAHLYFVIRQYKMYCVERSKTERER